MLEKFTWLQKLVFAQKGCSDTNPILGYRLHGIQENHASVAEKIDKNTRFRNNQRLTGFNNTILQQQECLTAIEIGKASFNDGLCILLSVAKYLIDVGQVATFCLMLFHVCPHHGTIQLLPSSIQGDIR